MKKLFKFTLISIFSLTISGCVSTYSGVSGGLIKEKHEATMKPYIKRGEVIQPKKVALNQEQLGKASWYGPGFNGKLTSSGEKFNMYALTAAHKTLPMGTLVRVQNLANGKSVIVKINDRGPFVEGRVIDCSYAAAKKIGLDKAGIAPVKLTVIKTSKYQNI